jgi:hypothetical protein
MPEGSEAAGQQGEAAPSEEEMREQRRAERAGREERQRAAVAHNAELGAAVFKHLARLNVDERVLKVLIAVDALDDLADLSCANWRPGRQRLSMLPEPLNGFGEGGAWVWFDHLKDFSQPLVAAQHRVCCLPWVIRVVERDASGVPLPVEQSRDLGGETGVGPVVGVDHVAGPEAVRGSIEGRDDCSADALDGYAVKDLRAAVWQLEFALAARHGLDQCPLPDFRMGSVDGSWPQDSDSLSAILKSRLHGHVVVRM